MKLFQFQYADGEVKCSGCNWETMKLFVIAESLKEANKLLEDGNAGLCGVCMCELIGDEEYRIFLSVKRRKEWKKIIGGINRKDEKS